MGTQVTVSRRAFGGLLVGFALMPAASVYAQGGPDNRAAPVTISESGTYAQVAGPAIAAAFDRAMQELDGAPDGIRPEQVRDMSYRRRLLELRLLMDLHAYAYDPNRLEIFREVVDDAYERIGSYQDIPVVEGLLQAQFRPDQVGLRQLKMNVALAAIRSQAVREPMRAFLSTPATSLYGLSEKDRPRIWQIAGQTPSDDFDSVGNAARLGASALAGIQASDPYIADIFNPDQEEHFHDVRKAIRSVLLLMQMFPDARAAMQPIAEPMFELVSQYGDVNDAIVAYRAAPNIGANQDAAAALLRDEFTKAQKRQGVVTEQRTFEALIGALSQVQARHHR